MLYWSAFFFVMAVVSAVAGLSGVSQALAFIGAFAFFVSLAIGVVFLVAGIGTERDERRNRSVL